MCLASFERPSASKPRGRHGLSFEIIAWTGIFAVSVWKAIDGRIFFVFFALFGCYRLASAVALHRVENIISIGQTRRETAAAWLYMGRTAVTGAFITVGSIVAMILHPHAVVIIVGVCGILAGQAVLIVGVQLLTKLGRDSLQARRSDPPTG